MRTFESMFVLFFKHAGDDQAYIVRIWLPSAHCG